MRLCCCAYIIHSFVVDTPIVNRGVTFSWISYQRCDGVRLARRSADFSKSLFGQCRAWAASGLRSQQIFSSHFGSSLIATGAYQPPFTGFTEALVQIGSFWYILLLYTSTFLRVPHAHVVLFGESTPLFLTVRVARDFKDRSSASTYGGLK